MESLEDECSLAFGWERFSGELYAGTSGTVSPAASFDGDDYVQVNGGSVLLLTVGSEVINRGQGHYIMRVMRKASEVMNCCKDYSIYKKNAQSTGTAFMWRVVMVFDIVSPG